MTEPKKKKKPVPAHPLHVRQLPYATPTLRYEMLQQKLRGYANDNFHAQTIAARLKSEQQSHRAAYDVHREDSRKRKREKEDAKLEEENAQLVEYRNEQTKRMAFYMVNPFADVTPPRPPPPPPSTKILRSGRIVIATTPVGRRRKCGFCRNHVAIFRQRVYWNDNYEMIGLCSYCDRRRQNGEILNFVKDLPIAETMTTGYDGSVDDTSTTNTDTTSDYGDPMDIDDPEDSVVQTAAAATAAETVQQNRQLTAAVEIERYKSYRDMLWTKNTVRQLAQKAISLPGAICNFVSSIAKQSVVTPAVAATSRPRTRTPGRRGQIPPGPSTDPRRRSGVRKVRKYTHNDPRLFFGYLS